MSNDIAFVKNEILDFFRDQKARAGSVLSAGPFAHQRVKYWNPKQEASYEAAVEALVGEGAIEIKEGTIIITQKGVDSIYPEVGNSVRNEILNYFKSINARAGHVLHAPAFIHTVITHWNPKQHAAFEHVLDELIKEGLVEEKNGNIALTIKGVGAIY